MEFLRKIKAIRVRTVDGKSIKTINVDESKPLSELMIPICSKMGLTNHDEFSLVRDPQFVSKSTNGYHDGQTNGKGGLRNTIGRRKDKEMQQLKDKLHTDSDIAWVDPTKTLREQQIGDNEELTLRRKFFFSDTNVDTRDPAELNMLYAQCRDGVLKGAHPVSREIAIQLAALQCYIEYGPYVEGVEKQIK